MIRTMWIGGCIEDKGAGTGGVSGGGVVGTTGVISGEDK